MIKKTSVSRVQPKSALIKHRTLLPLMVVLFLIMVMPTPVWAATSPCGTPVSDELVESLVDQAPRLKRDVLRLAIAASDCAAARGEVRRQDLLTVIDYSIPSTDPRLWVFDRSKRELLFEEYVAHGVNSGSNMTNKFSNIEGSRQSSIGLYVTDQTYVGRNGYSLRLRGLDKGYNDLAMKRAIVMHGAPYVNPAAARSQGRLGRSWGCPAVRSEVARSMIDTVKGGSPIFAYYPDTGWLTGSSFLPR